MKNLLVTGLLSAAAYWIWKNMQPPRVLLSGKVVLITGASAGIGRAAAKTFAAQGATVVIAARRRDLLQTLEEELGGYGAKVLAVEGDLLNDADLEGLVDTALKAFGRIDVLVNNAAVTMGGPFETIDADEMRRMVRLNVTSLIRLTQLVVPIMKRQGGGAIVNVGSVAGNAYTPGQAVYGATKAALHGFTGALRRELQGTGIVVSEIIPGWTQTDMIGSFNEAERRDANIGNALFPINTPESVAGAVVNAVRYQKNEVLLGGPGMIAAVFAERIFPGALDAVFEKVMDKDRLVESLKNLGA